MTRTTTNTTTTITTATSTNIASHTNTAGASTTSVGIFIIENMRATEKISNSIHARLFKMLVVMAGTV